MTGCGPSTTLTYKVRSAYQFIPTVLAEWRWANFHCPWAHNGTPWHPFGYVCSVGVAGGPAINPNNGGPAAEVFGGRSVGIQRFSILIGAHHGRYQEYGGRNVSSRHERHSTNGLPLGHASGVRHYVPDPNTVERRGPAARGERRGNLRGS